LILTIIRHRIAILMLQYKHVFFQCDEVQVLIVNFVDVCDAAGLKRCCRQIFKLLPRNWRDEVEMVDIVKAVLEVLCNSSKILFGRCTKVNRWNVRNAVTVRVELTEMTTNVTLIVLTIINSI
jgi:hypothetical protein